MARSVACLLQQYKETLEACQRLLLEVQYNSSKQERTTFAIALAVDSLKVQSGEEHRWSPAGLSRSATRRDHCKQMYQAVILKLDKVLPTSNGVIGDRALDNLNIPEPLLSGFQQLWHGLAVSARRARVQGPSLGAPGLIEDIQYALNQIETLLSQFLGTYPDVDYTKPMFLPPVSNTPTFYPSVVGRAVRPRFSDPGAAPLEEYSDVITCEGSFPHTRKSDGGELDISAKEILELVSARASTTEQSRQDTILSWLSGVGMRNAALDVGVTTPQASEAKKEVMTL